MSAKAKRFARVELGELERLMATGSSEGAAFLHARIRTHAGKRSIPSLLNMGEAGLTESLSGGKLAIVRRQMRELEAAGVLLVDRAARLLYIPGAVETDPPRSESAVTAFARQWVELPPGAIRQAIAAEMDRALEGADAFSRIWKRERQEVDQAADQPPAQPAGQPTRQRSLRDPRSDTRDPEAATATPDQAARVTAVRRAWNRLPSPPFAAAADDVVQAAAERTDEELNALIRSLGSSKWVEGEHGLRITPTLQRLLGDSDYWDRIVAGEFASLKTRWSCPECGADHDPLADCAQPCRGCGRRHGAETYCARLRELEYAEREPATGNLREIVRDARAQAAASRQSRSA